MGELHGALPRRRQRAALSTIRRLRLEEGVLLHGRRSRQGDEFGSDPDTSEVDVADQRVADLVIACPGEDERRNQRAAARRARKLELSASYAGDGAFTAGSASKTVR